MFLESDLVRREPLPIFVLLWMRKYSELQISKRVWQGGGLRKNMTPSQKFYRVLGIGPPTTVTCIGQKFRWKPPKNSLDQTPKTTLTGTFWFTAVVRKSYQSRLHFENMHLISPTPSYRPTHQSYTHMNIYCIAYNHWNLHFIFFFNCFIITLLQWWSFFSPSPLHIFKNLFRHFKLNDNGTFAGTLIDWPRKTKGSSKTKLNSHPTTTTTTTKIF